MNEYLYDIVLRDNIYFNKRNNNLSGAHNLGVGELSEEAKGLKGEAYLKAVEAEMTGDHAANEGSLEDNEQTSDKLESVQEKDIKE